MDTTTLRQGMTSRRPGHAFAPVAIGLLAAALTAGVSRCEWIEVDTFENISTNDAGNGGDDPSVSHTNSYVGIWYSIGQANEYGAKYSGGLATYPANMFPMASYAAAVNKTFFVYGGTTADGERKLHIMCSYYDHQTGMVPIPTVVRASTFSDAHANPAIAIDDDGYVWVFCATRHGFEGRRYRSRQPYDIAAFDLVDSRYMAYPQPWHMGTNGFFFAFTQYTGGRELYFQTSSNGVNWSAAQKFAGFGGHYQNSMARGNRFGTAFNYHPGGVDKRTDLYYMQTDDQGRTWATADGTPLTVPLNAAKNAAMVIDYQAQDKLVYIHDTNLDTNGYPYILYLTSSNHAAGPAGDPRTWHVTHWDGTQWHTSDITNSTHNYDVGCLHIEDDGTWRVIGPTAAGPQAWGTGGEVEMWVSADQGSSWSRQIVMTSGSANNHTYVRRPVPAQPDFYAFWADGDTEGVSPVRLYFGTKDGSVYQLPVAMTNSLQAPVSVP